MSRQDRTAWIGSVTIHVVAIGLAWMSTLVAPEPLQFESFEIELVAAPAPDDLDEAEPAVEEELVVETPDPEPPAEETEPAVEEETPVETPPEERQPEPEPEETEPEEQEPERTEPEEEPTPTPTSPPEEPTESTSTEEINVRMEGLRRDYPAYYEDIVRQMRRCFRWTDGGSWRATVQFTIRRDGGIPGGTIDIFRPSGNFSFDLRAVEAVECAGQRLGPLPEDLPWDELPVRFNFTPSGTDRS